MRFILFCGLPHNQVELSTFFLVVRVKARLAICSPLFVAEFERKPLLPDHDLFICLLFRMTQLINRNNTKSHRAKK